MQGAHTQDVVASIKSSERTIKAFAMVGAKSLHTPKDWNTNWIWSYTLGA